MIRPIRTLLVLGVAGAAVWFTTVGNATAREPMMFRNYLAYAARAGINQFNNGYNYANLGNGYAHGFRRFGDEEEFVRNFGYPVFGYYNGWFGNQGYPAYGNRGGFYAGSTFNGRRIRLW